MFNRVKYENETYTYRGISFEKIEKGWIFKSSLPGASFRYGHWCRFFTKDERDILDNDNESVDIQIKIMKKGIERAINDNPMFTSDLRDINKT